MQTATAKSCARFSLSVIFTSPFGEYYITSQKENGKLKKKQSGGKNQMIKCEKGNVSINGAGNEVIHDLSEIVSRTYSSFSKAFGEEKTKQMIFKAVNAGMGADK
jgi:hypothetical protein